MGKHKGTPLKAFAIYLLAAITGIAGGLLGCAFQQTLNWIQHLLTGPGDTLSKAVRANLDWWQTMLVPTVGGFAAGLVLLLLRGQKAPFGVSDLVVLVQLRKGTIRVRESLIQILSSACTIGSGGSIGKEGANSQIAATVAAWVSRITHLGSRQRAVLIGCGVAAGMATSYNAPIAGAIFVMEIVLGNFAMDVFAPIVLASVVATMIRWHVLGEGAIYADIFAKGTLQKLPWELILASLLLGVLCGFGGPAFRAAVQFSRRLFQRLRLPAPFALALGGLVVGGIGIWRPEAWGNGFEVIEIVAKNTPPIAVVLTLFLWKMVATCATIGSGGLGGIFTPNLVIGAAFGSLFAFAVDQVHGITALDYATFAFVGMAGLTAATMHAPVTAVVLVFELTGHYELTLPVMLCSIVASITASLIDEDSYYTAAIKQRGEQLPSGIEDMAIKSTFVRDVLRKDVVTVRDTARFQEVMTLLASHRGDTIYVTDVAGSLIGRVELQDVKYFLNDPSLTAAVIAGDLTRPVVTVGPDDSIAAVMPRFDDPELREIPVVSIDKKILGRVLHQDVITTLGSEVLGQHRRATRLALGGADDLRLPAGYALKTLPLPDQWTGLAVDALPPQTLHGVVVVMAIRDVNGRDEEVAATPDLVLQAGWKVVVMGTRDAIARLESAGGAESDPE